MSQSPAADLATPSLERSVRWQRMLLLILLSATCLNYANRFTFTQTSPLIKQAFDLDNEQYGAVESAFSTGFAMAPLVFGTLADVISVRWLYPAVVLAWSAAGLSTVLVGDYTGLLLARFLLGFFEAGHWACALRTTQRVFSPAQRTKANSVLQGGASLGAVAVPLLVILLAIEQTANWQSVFWIVGVMGLPWAIAWLATVSEADVNRPVVIVGEDPGGRPTLAAAVPFTRIIRSRRFLVLLIVVLSINVCWHYIRVWLPLTLNEDHGYSLAAIQYFTAAYYSATFVGCLAAGWLTTWLADTGWHVHRARLAVFLLAGLLTSLSVVSAFAPAGALLLGSLLVVGFGSLGLFPVYYSLVQEISAQHQGKVGGTLGVAAWAVLIPIHWAVDQNPVNRPYVLAGVGLLPLFAFAVLAGGWNARRTANPARESA